MPSKRRLKPRKNRAQHGVDRADEEPADRETDQQARGECSAPVQPFVERIRPLGRRRRQAQVAGQKRGASQTVSSPPTIPKIHQGRASFFGVTPSRVFPAAGFRLLGPEDGDGPRRGQGHGVDGRNDHRGGDGQGELAVELAGEAGDEAARQEHANRAPA